MDINFTLKADVTKTFKTQLACNSLDIDIEKKSVHNLTVKNVDIESDYNIGLIVGASGSGKTTIAKHLFGDDCFKAVLNEDLPILEQFPESMNYEDCAKMLSGIGLTSVPCWVRPVKTLSNGQKARAEAAILMSKSIENEVVLIDEWTSVVDRQVAKIMSHSLQKFARRYKKKIIVCSCHYDIGEWLNPDWVLDCNAQNFVKHEAKKKSRNEQLTFEIKRVERSTWRYFSKYHYLSANLPGGELFLFGLFINGNQIGFQCFANYVPYKDKRKKKIFHSNRTVVHPDYQGFGLGQKLIDETSKIMAIEENFRIMAKFSSLPIYKQMIQNDDWKFLGVKRLMGKMKTGGNMARNKGITGGEFGVGSYREGGVKTFQFEFKVENFKQAKA